MKIAIPSNENYFTRLLHIFRRVLINQQDNDKTIV